MATMNISLPEELKDFAQKKATGGGFSTPSDYIRSLIRADRERVLGELEALLLEGINSGVPIEWTPEKRDQLRKTLQGESARGSTRKSQ